MNWGALDWGILGPALVAGLLVLATHVPLGAQVLDRLYAAADDMAADEQWSDETYDQVSAVFERTTGEMADLFTEMKAGKVDVAAAKERALAVRDEATGELSTILGPEGLERLKGYIKDDAPVGPR